ncbi:MAG: rod-binding protein [Alphaproteobacteria bacterium]|nr:rod-binding protein [Alphaproteobacteria bacterium]
MQINTAQATPRQREVAQRFEANILSQMLAPMFSTLSTRGTFGGGAAEEQWRPMLTEAYATRMAASGGIGLAPSILAHMLRQQTTTPEETRP